ncbi:MAG TPA: hypothetical protein VM734_20070 [Kofleriaceae bacterium]|nr:hypothetical protein [Kofleriaceae bacterium]
MNLRREATKTIWKTVVFAGAMLGSAGCSKKQAPTTPATTEDASDDTAANPCATPDEADPCGYDDPCADPCGRPRGVSDEGDVGRGFILS